MSKAQDIVEVFSEWLDGFAELQEWEKDELIGEAEWYALEMKVLQILEPPIQRPKDKT